MSCDHALPSDSCQTSSDCKMEINIQPGLNPTLPLSRVQAKRLIQKILATLAVSKYSLTVNFVGDAEIARINKLCLGLFGPTNVLSFPAEDKEKSTGVFGEVWLCVPAAGRESFLYGQSQPGQLVRLLTHGFLHLAGFCHGPQMQSLTETAVETITAQDSQ